MTIGPVELTTRDIAATLWLVVIAIGVLIARSTRMGLVRVAGSLTRLLGIFVLYAAWVVILLLVATRIPFGDGGLWDLSLLKDTVIWFMVSGLALLLAFPKATTEHHFYLRRAFTTVSGTSLLQFYLGLVTFDLWVEILLPVPIVFVQLLLATTARGKTAGRATNVLIAVSVLLVVGFAGAVGVVLASGWTAFDWGAQWQSFLLTIWLTLGALPFVAWLSLYSNYQLAFLHMRGRNGSGAPLRAKLALVLSFHVRSRELGRFAGSWPRQLPEAAGFRAGRSVIRDFRRDLAKRDAADHKKAEDLVRYAGVTGTDGEGRRLDRREFAETISALELLSSAHMGWYRNPPEGRYKRDVSGVLSVFARGLPEEHGIVMKVRKNGQAWYAWRRTISGWVLAVGAIGPPPNQWFYDGPEPPKGYPGSDVSWGSRPFDQSANWIT